MTDPFGSPHHLALVPGWRLWRQTALRSAGLPFGWLEPMTQPPGELDEQAARRRSAEAIRELLGRQPFLTALTWQNPTMVDEWVGGYAAAVAAGERPKLRKARWRETKLARYAQRYCAKNDTIGFFGPVGWARLADDLATSELHGSAELAGQSVYFEVWAIRELAAHWARDPRLLPHLPVRLHPAVGLDGGLLYRPRREPERLPASEAALLRAIDGRRRFADVTALAGAGDAELLGLRDRGLVLIGFTVPISEWPERALAAQVKQIEDPELRDELLDELERLEQARGQVAAASEPADLLAALTTVRTRFDAASGGLPDRHGRFGRLPLYPDARRDTLAVVGADVLDRLRTPLGLLLDTARWLVDQVAEELTEELRRCHAKLGGGRVSLSDLLLAAAEVLSGAPGTAVHEVAADFRARWAEIIPPAAETEVRLTSEQVRPLVNALFPPGPKLGWSSARYHSPDLMLGYLDGPDADPVWVLGELHVALNTLESRFFHTQALDRGELAAAAAVDLAPGRILPLYPVDSPEVTSRTYPPTAFHLDTFTYWSYTADEGHPEGVPSLPAAGLTVEDRSGELVVHAPGQDWQATALEFLGEFVTAVVVNQFQLRERSPHAPRVRIDDLVVCRESWDLPAAELAAIAGTRYGHPELRAWLLARGVPRHAFFRTQPEPKPAYVDLDAPLLLHNLAAAARRAADSPDPFVRVSEMLPGPAELWLADAEGRRLTSEFRIVAVDDRDGPAVFQTRPGEGADSASA